MPKTLIITLGTGPGIENGIARSIEANHPDKVIFIATRDSLNTIKRLESSLGYSLQSSKTCILEDGVDIENCWSEVSQVLRSIIRDRCLPHDIFVDFTSGTKAMSAGAVLAAIGLECGGLVYVTGKRGKDGRVISGTERVATIAPNQILIEARRKLLIEFFNTFQYNACLKLIQDARRRIASVELQTEFNHLENIVQAYSWWDRFAHSKSLEYFRQLPRSWSSRWSIDTSRSKEMVSRIARQRESYSDSKEIKDKYSEGILADLLANADRRATEGKYDDAVARLYRAVELTAQLLLSRRNIDTSSVRLDDLPQSWHEEHTSVNGPIQLGQEKAFSLLENLGEKIGERYRENKNLRNYLRKRNDSVLAHGIGPISGDSYQKLAAEVNNLVLLSFPQLNIIKEKCLFPRLELL